MDIAVHFVSLLWDMLRQAHRLGHGAAAVATLAERRKSSLEALVEHCKILVLAVAVLVAGGAGAHSPMWSFSWHHEDLVLHELRRQDSSSQKNANVRSSNSPRMANENCRS